MKGKGGSVNASKAKKIVRDQTKKQFLKEIKGVKQQIIDEHKVVEQKETKTSEPSALDRFKQKKKRS